MAVPVPVSMEPTGPLTPSEAVTSPASGRPLPGTAAVSAPLEAAPPDRGGAVTVTPAIPGAEAPVSGGT